MIHTPYPVILDACVLYPSPLRDLLMHLGIEGLFQPKWTEQIQNEWQRNLLINRPDIDCSQLKRTNMLMNKALPDANVTDYETIINGLELPDPDDRHVLAAAIKSKSEVIVTANLKDFPEEYLRQFDVEAIHPDEFIFDLLDLNAALVLRAVRAARSKMQKPPKSVDEYLDCLFRLSLTLTVTELQKYRLAI
ncbi:PIN domain-containing protein [Yersinia enterocolitica]|uniref:PIN domain-containing protein n=1 Tax=Yersinia enterocolitica TaxID=630 RepID=UPI003CFFDBD7